MEQIKKKFPKTMNNYHECFLGGGSVLLTVLSLQKEGELTIKNKICAYDLNPALINTYNQIKCNYSKVLVEMKKIIEEFGSILINTNGDHGRIVAKTISHKNYKTTREHYYYWTRKLYNESEKTTPMSAAYFIFLNKTGFKGMFREGNKGFNIPYGQKDRKSIPKIIDIEHIKTISKLIENVEFECCDFENSFSKFTEGDFVYLDPPYAPENKNSFVSYTKDGFGLEKHKSLFKLTNKLTNKKIKFLLSNAKVPLVIEHFDKKIYTIKELECRRAINSKDPGSTTKEVLINN